MKRITKRILCAALILAACLTSGGCDLLLTLDEGKSARLLSGDEAPKPMQLMFWDEDSSSDMDN